MAVGGFAPELDPRFKLFHELMPRKVREILLVSTPYDAWIMEEDGRLSEQAVSEYQGLNLTRPPRLRWVPSPERALAALRERAYDMAILVARSADWDLYAAGGAIKQASPDLPVAVLSHKESPLQPVCPLPSGGNCVDRVFVWSGNRDILVAIVKSVEDQLNVDHDTQSAGIRVLILVEDSPVYLSLLLPILYKELVIQTQEVMEEGLNADQRLLAMRARPKILVAQTYEEALGFYERYKPYVQGVLSDVRYPRGGELDDRSGVDLLRHIHQDRFDIPILLMSEDPSNAERAGRIPAAFVAKFSPTLLEDVREFVLNRLGFGDFVFRLPDGTEIARAGNLRAFEKELEKIPPESFAYHCQRNDISRWLFARGRIRLASEVRPLRHADFSDVEAHRRHLVSIIRASWIRRQRGLVVDFDPETFDCNTEFTKVHGGSLGGKARGLAFVSSYLLRDPRVDQRFKNVDITIPPSLVITTDGFQDFVRQGGLAGLAQSEEPDEEIARRFLEQTMPDWITSALRSYLLQAAWPLAVRSSSLLEDGQFHAYAGLYKTYMLPNDHPDLDERLAQLSEAIKLVYASTYHSAPRAFARRVGHRTAEEEMAVVVQRLVGRRCGAYFYPAVSGVAQSHNYYPFGKANPEDGAATVALGLGKTIVEGEKALRFCPAWPEQLPQRSTVEDILEYSQRHFYALCMGTPSDRIRIAGDGTLERRDVAAAAAEPAVRMLSSTFAPEDGRIRDSIESRGAPVLTFARILKYREFPLAEIVRTTLDLGCEGMGCPVELEFSVDLPETRSQRPEFCILQLRPMTARGQNVRVEITPDDKARAVCRSRQALGNGVNREIADIVFVKPDVFNPARTRDIASEIGRLNGALLRDRRPYLLVGPGRWGSADPWLGIPVSWSQVCALGAIVETAHEKLNADPSQGAHFFHNITSLGISYLTVGDDKGDFLNWEWLASRPRSEDGEFVAHVRLTEPLIVKVDGRTRRGVIVAERAGR